MNLWLIYFLYLLVPSGSAVFSGRGVEKWNGRRRRYRSPQKWTIQRSSAAQWQIQLRPIHVQNLSFGIKGAVIHSAARTKGFAGDPRRSMERVSVLSNSYHRELNYSCWNHKDSFLPSWPLWIWCQIQYFTSSSRPLNNFSVPFWVSYRISTSELGYPSQLNLIWFMNLELFFLSAHQSESKIHEK